MIKELLSIVQETKKLLVHLPKGIPTKSIVKSSPPSFPSAGEIKRLPLQKQEVKVDPTPLPLPSPPIRTLPQKEFSDLFAWYRRAFPKRRVYEKPIEDPIAHLSKKNPLLASPCLVIWKSTKEKKRFFENLFFSLDLIFPLTVIGHEEFDEKLLKSSKLILIEQELFFLLEPYRESLIQTGPHHYLLFHSQIILFDSNNGRISGKEKQQLWKKLLKK